MIGSREAMEVPEEPPIAGFSNLYRECLPDLKMPGWRQRRGFHFLHDLAAVDLKRHLTDSE